MALHVPFEAKGFRVEKSLKQNHIPVKITIDCRLVAVERGSLEYYALNSLSEEAEHDYVNPEGERYNECTLTLDEATSTAITVTGECEGRR